MGYTHYWRGIRNPIDAAAWPAAIEDCDKLITAAAEPLRLDLSVNGQHGNININGDVTKDEDHEPFVMPRTAAAIQASDFEFCKTAVKPYDKVVTACLARLAETGLYVSSDGDEEDWQDGLTFANEVLGRPVAYPVGRED